MALPIQPTPILKGRTAKAFEERIKNDLSRPAYLKSTPRLEQARAAVKAYALKKSE
jgi:hypothetical protein